MNSIRIQAAVCSDKGRVRGNNEDNYCLNGRFMNKDQVNKSGLAIANNCFYGIVESDNSDFCQIYAVCDGMGGAERGEEASYCAVSGLARYHYGHCEMYAENELINVIRSISDEIHRQAIRHKDKSGTTLAMVSIKGEHACIANVGDSRVYAFSGGKLRQISLDHSEVQRMVSMGMITAEEALTHPRKHVINQYMGMPSEIRVSPKITENISLHKGDVFVLCSDGLTDMVRDHEIEQILRETTSVGDIAARLTAKALSHGGRDNVTVMVLQVMESVRAEERSSGRSKARLVQKILTGTQILAGSALAISLADLIYLFINS